MGVPGAPRIARIRQLTTISTSAKCARISAMDHFPGAGRRCSLDQALELPGGPRLEFERILLTDVAQNALAVRLGRFLHWPPPSGKACAVLQPPRTPRRAGDIESKHIGVRDGNDSSSHPEYAQHPGITRAAATRGRGSWLVAKRSEEHTSELQ